MGRGFRFVAAAAARALADKKAEDVTLLHVSRISPLTDYMLLATATSKPHLDALEQELDKAAKDYHLTPLRRSRPRSEIWRVVDYGGVIVHLMTAESRSLYALEKIYPDARRVNWRREAAPRAR
ncbi:MAG: ribosome silencing factor [Elusimicrobia bacterium]|nr:ribosome silencing factor [Elusimicrobiota bacterium]MDE2236618.1 ribosome silencing factor [Elusimicrobiota bacterium]MDE2424304.1 ribosome silencing factor [Elusimicrobiota bacterium]